MRAMAIGCVLVTAVLPAGCLVESHELLTASDGGGGVGATEEGDTGPSGGEPTWADCESAVRMGRHMDRCTFSEGSECGGEPSTGDIRAITCIDGRLLMVDASRTAFVPVETCTGSIAHALAWIEVLAAGGGCVDLQICRDSDTSAIQSRTCQQDPLPSVRADAAGASPWTSCEAALQGGMDGDPCEGDLRCFGNRSLGPSTASNSLFVHCDGGILRMMPMTSIVYGGLG